MTDAHAADAAEIVAQQIDDHQILGAILLAGAQFGGERGIFGGIPAARPCALDRPRLDLAVAQRTGTAPARRTADAVSPNSRKAAKVAGLRRRSAAVELEPVDAGMELGAETLR